MFINFGLGIFFSFAVLFLCGLFAFEWKLRIFLFVCFLSLCYLSIPMLLGMPKPVSEIFMYSHDKWDNDEVVVVGGWWDNNRIDLILLESGSPRLYEWPMNQDFLDELKKAQETQQAKKGEVWGFKIKGSGAKSQAMGISIPTVVMPDPPSDHTVQKIIPPDIATPNTFHLQ
jgi:hypothetical protein